MKSHGARINHQIPVNRPLAMGLHHFTWRATASGLADETVVADAVAWLIGDHEAVEIERTTSYHGSAIHMIEAKTSRKGPALRCLARLGTDALETLLEEAEQRLDESNTLHFRVQFNALMNGEIVLAQAGEESVKGHTKVQVFPGQEGLSEARATIETAIAIANEERE